MRARIFVKLDLGNNSRAREGSGICRIDVSRQACIRSLEPEVGDGVFHGASNSSGSAKNRAKEPLVGAWNIGAWAGFTAATARKGREKVWHGWTKLFLSPSTLFRGRKIRRGLGASSPRAFRWLSENGWVIRGAGRVNLDLDLTRKISWFCQILFPCYFIPPFVLISFVIKLIRWLV